ncbi:MAG: nucleotidyltransferase family protein [Syntrophobacteraceae bacterium]|jgi:hypothetical protein|nr:nucleotidyltransferase family protein [Syntrophobacteraceae bacterium]
MDLLQELRNLTVALDGEGIEYALCGGLAMAVYAMPRATLDIDIMIEPSALLRTRRAVEKLGFSLEAELMQFNDGEVEIYRLVKIDPLSGEQLILDLLIVGPATQPAWRDRLRLEWAGGALSVVSPEGLILLKSLRNSGQDRDDMKHLRSIMDED